MILLNEDTIALKYIAVYYGIPRYGHKRCFLHRNGGGRSLLSMIPELSRPPGLSMTLRSSAVSNAASS